MLQVDKDAVCLQVVPLPKREIKDVQGVLIIKPDAGLAPVVNSVLFLVLVSNSELFLSTCEGKVSIINLFRKIKKNTSLAYKGLPKLKIGHFNVIYHNIGRFQVQLPDRPLVANVGVPAQ
jgi:hypothetical protein